MRRSNFARARWFTGQMTHASRVLTHASRFLIALLVTLCAAAAMIATFTTGAAAAQPARGSIALDGHRLGAAIRPTQFGAFVEEISHSVDGGLYAELIRNRDLKQNDREAKPSAKWPAAWSAVGAGATLSVSRAHPLTKANPLSLQLSVAAGATGGAAGVSNEGWWGIAVRPSTTYRVSFYVHASGAATHAPLTVALESDSGTVWAAATLGAPSGRWQRMTTTLTTAATIPTTLENRFVISTPADQAAGGTDWFAMVSVFPPTYDNLANGFRIDLAKRLAALHPGFLRIPGGNAMEGRTFVTRLRWERTIGPIRDRPGHFDSAWTGYWSQDGMGLLEYLELAQELHAQPILTVWDGYSIDGHVVPQSQLGGFVTSAVHEIQYATGSTSTYWGHQRALDGHPQPFAVHMVEIGNEDYFDSSGSYNAYRYPMFYDAIHRAFPHIRMIGSELVTSRPVYAVDRHLYRPQPGSLDRFAAHVLDSLSPHGPKAFISEYGCWDAKPTGDLAAAVGEAAFLTGTIRDADEVLGVSYAPTLVNVNAPQWPSSLIAFNALGNYVSPSYWVLKMLRDDLGRRVVSTRASGGPGTLSDVATESPGHTYLAVVNTGARAADMQVSLSGLGHAVNGVATVLSGRPSAQNSFAHPNRVRPRTRALRGLLGNHFSYRFGARSVTVLDISTAAAGPSGHGIRHRRARH